MGSGEGEEKSRAGVVTARCTWALMDVCTPPRALAQMPLSAAHAAEGQETAVEGHRGTWRSHCQQDSPWEWSRCPLHGRQSRAFPAGPAWHPPLALRSATLHWGSWGLQVPLGWGDPLQPLWSRVYRLALLFLPQLTV